MRAVGLVNTHPVAAYHTGGCESLRNGSNRRHQVAVSQNNVSSTAGWYLAAIHRRTSTRVRSRGPFRARSRMFTWPAWSTVAAAAAGDHGRFVARPTASLRSCPQEIT
jgi:hypothetical protein